MRSWGRSFSRYGKLWLVVVHALQWGDNGGVRPSSFLFHLKGVAQLQLQQQLKIMREGYMSSECLSGVLVAGNPAGSG